MKIIIRKGRVIDPGQGIDKKCDIFIENGIIVKAGKISDKEADTIIEAEGKLVVPGLIDMHTHLREPGREDKETIKTGVSAAVGGGFTTVSAMPNTDPACDREAHVELLLKKSKETGLAKVLPIGTLTKLRAGKTMSELGELKDAGCLAVSDDGDSVTDAALMRVIMEYASMVDLLVISHCEDKELAADGVMYEGYWSTVLGLKPIPAAAESAIVEREIRLAELTDARLHIAHVSTKESVEVIRNAKKRGVKVTAEVTPHHFTLTDEDLKNYDTNMKVNPPLSSAKDVEALKKGLKDGTIDVIATDHAPHLTNEKEMEFDYAPFGMIALETALPLTVMNLVDEGCLDWTGVIEKMALNPARILKYDAGTIKEGKTADITIIDPEKKWTYTKEQIRSKAENSPFIGCEMKGKATDVIVGGKIVMRDEEII